MPRNAYPEKPELPYQQTSVAMTDVIAYLKSQPLPAEVKHSTYVIFRNESGNGRSGVNNNYFGAQADGGRWPAKFDERIVGTVTKTENVTGKVRIFVAFASWTDSIDFLADRVAGRGLFVGGTTSRVLTMKIDSPDDLVRAYHKEWVTGNRTRNRARCKSRRSRACTTRRRRIWPDAYSREPASTSRMLPVLAVISVTAAITVCATSSA
jgi:hypothetical protein